jgi:hypothetical protein
MRSSMMTIAKHGAGANSGSPRAAGAQKWNVIRILTRALDRRRGLVAVAAAGESMWTAALY